jgi:type VII secretion protein EccB
LQSRRDQLQAYRFLTRRALAALVVGEPDLPEPPMRRLSLTTITGIMVAILVAAGFAAYGLIKPGSSTKLATGTIYVEKETGARFVLNGDTLHPTLNYTSAVLAAVSGEQAKQVPIKTVSSSTLAHKPHGSTIGIPGVPDSLPRNTRRLVRSPWTVCSQVVVKQIGSNVARVTVDVGGTAPTAGLSPDDGVIVASPHGGQQYLLWRGQRLKIGSSLILSALSLQSSQPLTVGTAFMNALPEGPTLTTPSVPSQGSSGPPVGNTRTLVGQLLRTTGTDDYRLVLSDGFVGVTPIEAALLQTLSLNGQRRDPIPISQAVAIGLHGSNVGDDVKKQFADLPGTAVPRVPDGPAQAGGICVVYRENAAPTLAVPAGSAPEPADISDSPQSQNGKADVVRVPAERAALVRGDNDSATRFVIAAPGSKFAASALALGGLGYGSVTPVTLPAHLLLLIPNGPALDTEAARRSISGS